MSEGNRTQVYNRKLMNLQDIIIFTQASLHGNCPTAKFRRMVHAL